MPYIKKEDRPKWDKLVDLVAETIKEAKIDEKSIDGNLNYFITRIMHKCYSPSYYNYNKAMGVLECIKQELYRRIVAPYEDKKVAENGDVD